MNCDTCSIFQSCDSFTGLNGLLALHETQRPRPNGSALAFVPGPDQPILRGISRYLSLFPLFEELLIPFYGRDYLLEVGYVFPVIGLEVQHQVLNLVINFHILQLELPQVLVGSFPHGPKPLLLVPILDLVELILPKIYLLDEPLQILSAGDFAQVSNALVRVLAKLG